MHPYLAEYIGTALLILFGNGVVANVVLARTKGHAGGWIVITAGWGLAVFVAAFCTAAYSGAHLNPAVTLALAAAGKTFPGTVLGYIAAQVAGAITGAAFVYVTYRPHFEATVDPEAKRACFCTSPAIARPFANLSCEAIGTFSLVLPLLLMTQPSIASADSGGAIVPIGLGSLGFLPVALLVVGIGLSLGGPTGYAINPARDLGPRIAYALLPIPAKGPSGWSYAWIPVVGPLLGALAATAIYRALVAG